MINMRYANLTWVLLAGMGLAGGIVYFSAPQQRSRTTANPEEQLFSGLQSPPEAIGKVFVPPAAASTNLDAETRAAQFLAADPEDNDGHFAALLDELCRSGQFETALALASHTSPDLQARLLKIVFSRWAKSFPEAAIKALDTIGDPQLHSIGLRAIADGWSAASSGDLAAYAVAIPPGADRDYVLGIALKNWSLQDPAALGDWLNSIPRGTEFDFGAALMLQKTDAVNRAPDVAMEWVENISDPAMRLDSLQRVFAEWMQTDPAAARQYIGAANWLSDSQKRQLLDASATVKSAE